MTTTTHTETLSTRQSSRGFQLTRIRLIGGTLLLIGAFFLFIATNTGADVQSVLTLDAANPPEIQPITVTTMQFLIVTGILLLVGGGAAIIIDDSQTQNLRNIRSGTLAVAAIITIPALIVWATADNSTNITVLFAKSLSLATPIAIGAMAGIWSERAGIINIAIEGMMLWAACFGFTAMLGLTGIIPDQTGVIHIIALLTAIISAGLFSLLHAWLSITFQTDQIISGTVLNIMALGATSFIRREYLLSNPGGLARLPEIQIPGLSEIPFFGDVLFTGQPIFYMMFIVILFTHIMLFYTRWGLRIRAVGENPHAADTLGINVNRSRWVNVFISGMIAGLAGAWFSMEATGTFNDNMTAGAGFIALAAVIFGKWYPFGAFAAALLFGFSQAFSNQLQIIGVNFPSQFLQMLPYFVTIFVLAGFIGRANPPKASGQPYVKE